jgi:hypothetical protein
MTAREASEMREYPILIAVLVLGLGMGPIVAPQTAWGEEQVLASGKFRGKSGHAASGGVRVVKTADGVRVVLDPDFRFDGAPDPKLGFGKNGYVKSTQFSALKSNSGEQSYPIPASLDTAAYSEFWIWCQQYSVPLGVAILK